MCLRFFTSEGLTLIGGSCNCKRTGSGTHTGVDMPTTSSSAASSRPGHIVLILFGVCLAALMVLLAAKILAVITLLAKPGEQTSPEAANVYVARRVQHAGPIYGDWRVRPCVPAWYGPALYLPVAWIGRWVRADVDGLYLIGRSISLLSMLGTAGLMLYLLKQNRVASLVTACMVAIIFLTADGVHARFDLSFRADAPACFLTMAGLTWAHRSQRSVDLLASLVLFLLAFLYKQSSLVGPVAVAVWLQLSGRRRLARQYLLAAAAAIVGVAILLETVTGGMFSLNTIQALKGNTTLRAIPFMFSEVVRPAILPMTVAFYVFSMEVAGRKWDLLTIAFGISMIITAASTYRDGSSVNYYMIPLALACILTGRQFIEWWSCLCRPADAGEARSAGMGLLLALCIGTVRYLPDASSALIQLPGRLEACRLRQDQHRNLATFIRDLSGYLNGLPGPVLCQFNDMVLHCPRSILVDTCTFTGMADVGVFDDRGLIEDLRQGRIEAVVFDRKAPKTYQSTDFFSRRWQLAMDRRYELVFRNDKAEVYRPIGRGTPVQSEVPASTASGPSSGTEIGK